MTPKSIQEASCLVNKANRLLDDAELGISANQVAVLAFVANAQEDVTLGDVSKAMEVTPAVITGLIDRLEKQQAVKRVTSGGDRRRIYLQVTERGAEILIDAENALKAAA